MIADRDQCPCKKVKCVRYGDCEACKEHHSRNTRYLTACDRIKKKTTNCSGDECIMDKLVKIRFATEDDAQELLKIYEPYVRNTAVTFEYDVPSVEEFAGRIRNVLTKFPYIVAEEGGQIVGYAYVGVFKARPAYDWAVESSIYVKSDMRRNGVGRLLYEHLEAILKEQGILNFYACIACPEVEDEYLTRNSMKFHERLGFRKVGEFYKCGYKFNRWYNMVWMEKHIGDHVSNQPAVKWISEIKDVLNN